MSIKEEIEKVKKIGLNNITDLDEREKFRQEIKNLSKEARDKIWKERQGIKLPLPPPPPDPLGYLIHRKIKEGQQPKGECPICESVDIETFIEKEICGSCETPEETIECSEKILEATKDYIAGKIDEEELMKKTDKIIKGSSKIILEEYGEDCEECRIEVGLGMSLNVIRSFPELRNAADELEELIEEDKITPSQAMKKMKQMVENTDDWEIIDEFEKNMKL